MVLLYHMRAQIEEHMNVAQKTSSIRTDTHRILDRDDCNWLLIFTVCITNYYYTDLYVVICILSILSGS